MRISAIIQARMGSERLPGKVLMPLMNKTVLEHVIDRVCQAKKVDEVIVATSDQSIDDPICDLCQKKGVLFFRGDSFDVLDRYYKTAKKYHIENICRVTADCPLIDPDVIDAVISRYEKETCDYISTGRLTSTFPDGMDTEVFSFKILETAWNEAKLPSEREHVTPFIWKQPQRFNVIEVQNGQDLSNYRLTLDEPRDYELLQIIFQNLHDPRMLDIIEYIDHHPEIQSINSSIIRNAGHLKSLEDEEKTKS